MSLLSQASLVVTPNGYKEGKLYSVIPSDGSGDMSVVRATTATRVNSAGLVELVPYNYNTYSENFITSWGNDGTSTVTNNFTTAPNGMMTAAKLVSNVANGYAYKFITVPNGTFTLSYYVKASANTTISIAFNDIGGNGYIASYNIPVSTEWQRISLTANLVGTSLLIDYSQLQLGVEYYIWGCQINEGAIKDYQKTETRLNIPRLDYSNGTCPSLLVEPQRTNLVTYSSAFDNAAWVTNASPTITANTTTAPNGTLTADTISAGGANSGVYQVPSVSASSSYTFSVYVKNISSATAITIGCDFNPTNGRLVFNSVSGTITSVSAGITASSVTNEGNGWYRVIGTYVATGTPNTFIVFGGGVMSFAVWGAQLEAGSYQTSYIPTQSATVTRNADVISKTGISSLIGQTEGTMFVDFNYDNSSVQGNPILFSFKNTAFTNEVFAQLLASGGLKVQSYISGALQSDLVYSGATNGRHKIAYAYKQNDFILYIDGVQIAIDTSGNVAAIDDFCLGYFNSVLTPSCDYNASALWQTRLTNDELERLTGTGFNTYAEMANYYNYITQ